MPSDWAVTSSTVDSQSSSSAAEPSLRSAIVPGPVRLVRFGVEKPFDAAAAVLVRDDAVVLAFVAVGERRHQRVGILVERGDVQHGGELQLVDEAAVFEVGYRAGAVGLVRLGVGEPFDGIDAVGVGHDVVGALLSVGEGEHDGVGVVVGIVVIQVERGDAEHRAELQPVKDFRRGFVVRQVADRDGGLAALERDDFVRRLVDFVIDPFRAVGEREQRRVGGAVQPHQGTQADIVHQRLGSVGRGRRASFWSRGRARCRPERRTHTRRRPLPGHRECRFPRRSSRRRFRERPPRDCRFRRPARLPGRYTGREAFRGTLLPPPRCSGFPPCRRRART